MNWLDFLFDAAAKSAVVLAAAALIDWRFRNRSAASRHLVWILAVVAALAMPALTAMLPAWHVRPASQQAAPAIPVVWPNSPPVVIADMPMPAAPPAPPPLFHAEIVSSANTAASSSPIPWQDCVAAAWIAGTLALLLPVGMAMFSLTRLSRRATKIQEDDWLNLCAQITRDLGLRRRVNLLQTSERAMPMTWGILRPAILIPAEAETWPIERRSLVLMHELAHVKRRDALAQLLGQIARAAYWFNPLAWIAVRRLAHLRERACDDVVLNCGVRASDYAEELLTIALRYPPSAFAFTAVGIAMARSAKLESRLTAILNGQTDRRALTRRAIILALLFLAIAIVPLAALGTRAAAQDTTQPLSPEASTPRATSIQPSTKPAAAEYKIGEGDVLSVSVTDPAGTRTGDHPRLTPVNDSGEILLDSLSPIYVEGLTETQARDAIAKAYHDAGQFPNARVTVTVPLRRDDVLTRFHAEIERYAELGKQYGSADPGSRRILVDQLTKQYRKVEAARVAVMLTRIEIEAQAHSTSTRLLDAARPVIVRSGSPAGWSAKLDNGVTVELLGISEHPSKNCPWWKPDGRPMDAPYDDFGDRPPPEHDPLGREFAVRLTNPNNLPVDFSWQLDPATSHLVTGNLSKDGDAIIDIRAAATSLAAQAPTTTLRLGVAADPWRAVGFQTHIDFSIEMKNPDGFGDILFAPVTQNTDGLEETVSYTISNEETRLMAITADGKELKSSWSSSSGQGSLGQMTARFKDLRPADVSEFVLEARPYQWVVFENVSLWPK
jgi:beta-lactamase regulating signal transducer with metallopeptidase domain